MDRPSYFLHIDRIKNDPCLIEKEKHRLDSVISKISSEIKSAITPRTAPGLIWALAWEEIGRVLDTIQHLPETRLSDFCGHARYLRGVAASVPFQSAELSEDPKTQELLNRCDALWQVVLHREMIETLNYKATKNRKKRDIGAWMSLLGAFQQDLRYVEQVESRLHKLYGPFSSDVIVPALGLSVDEIVRGFHAIRECVADRLETLDGLMRPMINKWREFQKLANNMPDSELKAFVRNDPQREQVSEDFRQGMETAHLSMLFSPDDLKDVLGDKTMRWFEEFSFVPGQVNQDFTTPYDYNVIRYRPFARLPDNQFLLMDFYYCPFAPLNRLPEVFSNSCQVQRLTRRRDQVLEEDAQSLLAEVVKPQITVPNYYLPVGKNGVLAERDLLLLRDGTALIVESKAKPLRPIAEHRGNICKIESDVKQAIQQGYDQACSVHSYLFSQDDCIVLWDSDKQDKKELARVNRHDVRDALVIVVLDSYYGLIATDLAPWLQVNEGIGFPWVVDRDTLESILRVMSSFEQLVAFLRWRRNLHGVAVNEDEAVFAGFFLRHGPADVPRNAALVQLDASYADVFEADYFRRKGAPIDLPKEVGPPVWSSMQRDGDTITYKIDDEFYDAVDLKTGRSIRESAESQARTYRSEPESSTLQGKHQPHAKPRRNGPCPCGSGQKYKKCCLRRG